METIQAYVTLIKDILTGLAALTAAVIGIIGLQTWKKQLRGKTEYELAQRMAKAAYLVRATVTTYRRKLPPFEIILLMRLEEDSARWQESFKKINTEYQQRWEPIQVALRDLDMVSLEAQAIWGDPVKQCQQPLRKCLETLRRCMDDYVMVASGNLSESEEAKNERTAIMNVSPKSPFSAQIDAAVRQIEDFLKPYLKI